MLLSNQYFKRRLLVAFTAGLLAACGGDDDDAAGDNQPPVATITSPDGASTFRAGVAISFEGSATDPEDGTLGPTRLTWWADLHHADHTHPLQPETSGSGGTVTLPTRGHTEEDIFIRFHLRATDSDGATHEVTRDVQPQKVQVTLATNPTGLALTLDGQPVTAPHVFTGVVGIERDLVAAAMQNSTGAGARRYQFLNWSDGGSATHTIATPAANGTFTANYQDVGPVNNTAPTVTLTAPANNSTATQGVGVTVSANATDVDGNATITGVQFLENGAVIATDTTAPYSVTWTPATLGARTLTAIATDSQGASSTPSAARTVTVNAPTSDVQAPTMTGITPANLTANIAAGNLAISATATDNVAVVSMEFQVDGVQVGGLDTTSPYGTTIDTNQYASGQHVIRARARDAAGNVSNWQTATVQFGGTRTQPAGFTRNTNWVTTLSSATAFAQAPDGRWFIAQQGGQLRVVQNGTLLTTPFITLSVEDDGERGLLGVAIDPNFATNRYLYLYYTTAESGIHNRISRFTALSSNPNIVDPTSEMRIADLPVLSSATNHNGGALHFGADGKLYVAVGDNANSSRAPDLNDPFGKMLRFNVDAPLSIPNDNPVCTTAATLRCAIWARGLRNPFTFAVRASDGRIHINDVGEGTWEEVNVGAPAANYGWPSTEGPTSAAGITGPLYAYDHNANTNPGGFFSGCAITGGAFYGASGAFPAAYRNSYYFADYCTRFVARIDPDAGAQVAAYAFGALGDAPVDMRVGTDGALYVLTRGGITRFSAP